jgi:predicted metal-binding membrane protein
MLVMFAAGVAHLYWMALLALIMVIEKTFPSGNRIVYPVGAMFAFLSITTLIAPGSLPAL